MCLCRAGGGAPFNPLRPLRPLRALPCLQTGLVAGTLPSPLLQPSPSPPHAPPPPASSARGVAGSVTGRTSRCHRVCPPDAPGTCTVGLFFPPRARAPASWPHMELPSLCPPRTQPPSGWEPRPGSAKAESHQRHRVPRQPGHQQASCRCQPLAKPRDAVPRAPAQAPPLT